MVLLPGSSSSAVVVLEERVPRSTPTIMTAVLLLLLLLLNDESVVGAEVAPDGLGVVEYLAAAMVRMFMMCIARTISPLLR